MEVIELSITNLYANGYIVSFDDGSGEQMLLVDPLSIKASEGDIYHPYVNGERLDQIAWKYYSGQVVNASKLWWVIAFANNIFNPFDMSEYAGAHLLIPDIQKILLHI